MVSTTIDPLDVPIQFEGRLSLEEYHELRRLLSTRGDRIAGAIRWVLVVVPFLFFCVVTGIMVYRQVDFTVVRFVLVGLFLASLVFIGHLIGLVRSRLVPRRLEASGAPPFEFRRGEAGIEGIGLHTERYDFLLRWPAMSGCRISESMAIVYYENRQGHLVFPRSQFETAAAWERFRHVLNERLPVQ